MQPFFSSLLNRLLLARDAADDGVGPRRGQGAQQPRREVHGQREADARLAAAEAGDIEVVYLLGADEIDTGRLGDAFVIYQGSHGDRGAHRADIILPGACYTEENGLFVNTEGRPQLAMRANFAPGEAKENWAILRALSAELGQQLPWDSLAQLRRALIRAVPHLARIDQVPANEWQAVPRADLDSAAFVYPIRDFYLTNPIARASAVMQQCSSELLGSGELAEAAE